MSNAMAIPAMTREGDAVMLVGVKRGSRPSPSQISLTQIDNLLPKLASHNTRVTFSKAHAHSTGLFNGKKIITLDLEFIIMLKSEAGPSTLQSTSHLDPLPVSHPLSLKLRAIFDSTSSSSSQSEATQKALFEIEQRYARTKKEAPSRKNAAGSSYLAIDTERARNSLSRDAQDSLEESCLGFLNSLQVVDESLGILSNAMNELQESCNGIEEQLSQADESTRYLLQHADGLRKQMSLTSQQSVLLDMFLARFSLTPAQLESIESRSAAVGPSLFAAMDRLQIIRRDCQVLLAGQEEGTKAGMRAGMDIMDETSQLLDRAHQKIARWLNFEMRSFFREGMDVGFNVRESVKRLETREDLLRPALRTLAATRSQQLSAAFQRALTIGGPAPTFLPRPMELHAHDPIRYVGDMLAWVHQSVASEREFLTGMFSRIGSDQDQEGGRRVGQRRRGLEGSIDWTKTQEGMLGTAEIWTREVLDKILEGCDRLLKARIEQTVQSQEGCITTFRLASLIQFYRVVMDRTIGSRAALSKTLADVSVFAFQAFLGTLDNLAGGLQRFHESPDSDLGPPPPLLGACATLKELLHAHQISLSEADLFGDALPLKDLKDSDGSTDFSRVIQRFVDPLRELWTRMSRDITQKRPRGKSEEEAQWETQLFIINCIGYLKSVLEPYQFAAQSLSQLDGDLEKRLQDLIEAHHQRLLLDSGLLTGEVQDSTKIAKALDLFEDFLSSPHLLASPRLALLNVPARRMAVQQEALAKIANDYDAMVQKERESSGSEINPPRRNPEELRILLGIESGHTTSTE